MSDFKISFHHIGKPVDLASIKDEPATKYSVLFDMYTLDMQNNLSVPVQLHAFGAASSLNMRIQNESHVAFKVENIDLAMGDNEVIMPLYTPFEGYSCAMVDINGQLVELIETTLSEAEIWGDGIFKNSILYPDNVE